MIEIRIHGRGGQGAVIASEILSYAFFLEGKYSQSFPTFGAERRGAPVASFVRVADSFINERNQVVTPDYVVVLSGKLAETIDVASGIKQNGIIIINSEKENSYFSFLNESGCKIITVNINKIALKHKLGSAFMPIVNVPILGAFARITNLLKLDSLIACLPKFLGSYVEGNEQALKEAYEQTSLTCI